MSMYYMIALRRKGEHSKSKIPLPLEVLPPKKYFWQYFNDAKINSPQEAKIPGFTKMAKGLSVWLYYLDKDFEATCENILSTDLILT